MRTRSASLQRRDRAAPYGSEVAVDARTAGGPKLDLAVVDDHHLVHLGLRTALAHRRELHLLGGYATVDELLAARLPVALVLLDLRLADGSSPAANVRRLRDAGRSVLVFTSGEDPFLMREALRSDVLGVVRKSQPIEEVVEAVLQVASGHPLMTTEWAHAVERDPIVRRAGLSAQEERVLRLFADGARSGDVASELHITVGTLEDYVRRVRRKYAEAGRAAPTKVDLYKRAVEDGLLPAPRRG